MIGIGEIYSRYASGELIDDDAVAQLHAPAELDYQPLTEALVDFEVTVAASCCAGAIGADEEEELVQIARRLYFKDRTIDRILAGSSLSAARCAEVAELLQRNGST